ncbi:MAG: hypothetical protein NZ898_09050 [Myxococcota bacterium]|nr:hypothetical protein [Myxococcota bacterium]
MRRARTASLAIAAAIGAGCGARSAVDIPRPRDADIVLDAPVDGTVDAGADVTPDAPPAPPSVECGEETRYTAPHRPLFLEATVVSASPVVSESWRVLEQPPGSTALLDPVMGRTTTLRVDMLGMYVVEFTATDALGRTASCRVRVEAIAGPPVVVCPGGELATPVGVPLEIAGEAFDDEGPVEVRWRVLESPSGARFTLEPLDAPITRFRAETPGRYRLELTATDVGGATASCTVSILVTGPPVLMCPTETLVVPTRRPVTLRATAVDDVGIASARWTVVRRPAGSRAEPMPPDATTTRLTPDRAGDYLLELVVTDVEGMSSRCTVLVRATPTGPDAMCPPPVETRPLETVTLRGSGVDDGRIVSYRWRLVSSPMGSRAMPPSPADMASTRFTPDIAGEYLLELTVTDDAGNEARCTVPVRALVTEGIRIEMFWDRPRTDMDLHLLRPGARAWFDDLDDCYYANCVGGGLPWGGPGTADDPRLDIDDVDGFGPENINIDRPAPGTYRVGVHAFRDDGVVNRVTVRVYCGRPDGTPERTFGPVSLGGGAGDRPLWKVADVQIGAAGGCTVTDLSRGGRPWIVSESEARRAP